MIRGVVNARHMAVDRAAGRLAMTPPPGTARQISRTFGEGGIAVVSPDYSSLIAAILARESLPPDKLKIVQFARRFHPPLREAPLVGEFMGDGRHLLLFLHPDGQLSTYNTFFDEVNQFDADTERDWALRIGSRQHPELTAWITQRPLEGALTCPNCAGSGWAAGESREYACPDCDGRGWRNPPDAQSEG